MTIENIKINGVKNPMGYQSDELILSYTAGMSSGELTVEIFDDEACTRKLYSQKLDDGESFSTRLDFVPKKETRYYLRITDGQEAVGETWFETGTDFDAGFIEAEEKINHPVLFKEFAAEKEKILSARLYVTGVGLYEAYINGEKAGDEYLTPYCSDYNTYLQYQTYDVTGLMQKENRMEIMLGCGWYKGRFGLKHRENIFGDEFAAAAKLVIHYMDGSRQMICTDESWRAKKSHVVFSGIYDGEIQAFTADAGKTCSCRYLSRRFPVVDRCSLPVTIRHKIKPELYVSPKGEQILDFGQNFSGFVSFDIPLSNGQTIRLKAGEVLQEGCFYRDNLRTARAEFVYTSDGRRRTVRPHFTFFGFRYMLVEGVEQVCADDFTGNVIYSDLDETVQIAVDNEKINRLLQNCVWGQRSNFVDVPTDCPQRDERLGWTGDAEVFSKTACYQMDCRAFYAKYVRDLSVEQQKLGGAIPVYAPAFGEAETAYSVWGDAAAIIPWNLYLFYGDKALLKKQFPVMEQYLQSVLRQDDERGKKRLYDFGFHLGDWLSQDGASPSALKGATDEYFIASVYYLNSARITARAAEVLGMAEKAKTYTQLANEIENAVLYEYFTPSGKLAVDTQTAYTICVIFDVYRDWKKLVAGFADRIKRDGYKIKGGFVGATQLIQALLKAGQTETAFRILYSEGFPSWLYCVNLGATTIWERWNSLNADGSVSGTEMNSLNHYSYGNVAEAFYGYIAGVRPIAPGFKKAVIEPSFNYRLQKLDFSYNSASGRYAVRYRVEKNRIHLTVEIPYEATAELILPDRCRQLVGGQYDFVFDAPTEMEHPFSVDTPIFDLLADHRSKMLMKQMVPELYDFLSSQDMGLSGESLRTLSALETFSGIAPYLDVIHAKLQEI